MIQCEETFIIDTNTLIRPYNSYYSFDLVRGFWDQLLEKNYVSKGYYS